VLTQLDVFLLKSPSYNSHHANLHPHKSLKRLSKSTI
jgi:hypothetical protein